MTVGEAITNAKDVYELQAIYEALIEGGIPEEIALGVIASTVSPERFHEMREAYIIGNIKKVLGRA